MKKVINKAIILSVLLLAAVSPKESKSRKNQRSERGKNGIAVMAQGMIGAQPIVQSTGVTGGTNPVQGVVQPGMTIIQGTTQQPLTQGAVVKLFDEEKHLREKLQREKTYSALQYVALECIHIVEALDRAQNKLGLGQLALTNNTNPNTVLGKNVAVKYPDISNAGGFGFYLNQIKGFMGNGVGSQVTLLQQQPIGMFMTQDRSQEIVAVQDFVKKWSDLNTYLNTRPDDQGFIANFKASYGYLKNLVTKYLGQDLNKVILQHPSRYYNETSILIDLLNNQLLPKITNNPNYKVAYRNLQPEIKNLGYNARYVFVMTCDGIYHNGNGMNPNQANIKAWAETGKN